MSIFKIQNFGILLKTIFKNRYIHNPFKQRKAIAYNAILSMPGLLVLGAALADYFFDKDATSIYLYSQIAGAMCNEIANQI
jgi:uncharacterized BrkB/YihY/UPF0761 family membrane protein